MQTCTAEPEGGPVPRPPSTGPVAATWVAGTGAFLLLAAAAVFVAVSWDHLPEVAKLSLVFAVTGACIAGGRALRRTLPATGDVIFHLGAFLMPVDVAGLGMRAAVGWRSLLVAEGVIGVGVLGALAAASGSVVLAWAATAWMVVLAAGIAAVSPVPAIAVLAVAAVAAHVVGDRRRAVAWSSVAALGPVLGFAVAAALSGTGLGDGVLAELGADGDLLALAGCLGAAMVLGREAGARSDALLAGLAVAAGLSGVATSWASAGIPGETTAVALPVLFLVSQVVAALCGRDVFWRRPAGVTAALAEATALVVGGTWTAGLVLAGPFVETGFDFMSDVPGWVPEPASGASLAALALAWAVAGLRRRPAASTLAGAVGAVAAPWTGVLCALAAIAAVAVGTASGPAVAGTLLVAAAVLLWAGSPLSQAVGAGLALWAPVTMAPAGVSSLAALAAGAAAAAVVAMGAVVAARAAHPDRARGLAAVATAGAAAGTALAVAAGAEQGPALSPGVALSLFVAQAWILSVAAHRTDAVSGAFGRLGVLTAACLALGVEPAAALPVIALATFLLVVDTLRLHDRITGMAAAASLQALVGMLATRAGFDAPETGTALVLAAVVWSGLAALVDDEWRTPLVAAAAFGVGAGLVLASGDRRMLADAVLVTGGLLTAAGAVIGRGDLAHLGGVTATLGILSHLEVSGVTALEPYVAPVALHLVVAGWHARRSRTLGSWTAYAPAVALTGGAALAERLDGGSAWHAVVAGAVGVLAVACGGWRRLAGPLFLGTALLVGVTLIECLGALAGVPTWAWLALGGAVLLAVGVALERADASPAEAGRRLVDVISERFD